MIRIIEGIQLWLKSLGENMSDSVAAQIQTSEALVGLVERMDRIEDAVEMLASKTGQLYDEVRDVNARLGSYLTEQARKEASVRRIESEVREVDQRLRVVEGTRG